MRLSSLDLLDPALQPVTGRWLAGKQYSAEERSQDPSNSWDVSQFKGIHTFAGQHDGKQSCVSDASRVANKARCRKTSLPFSNTPALQGSHGKNAELACSAGHCDPGLWSLWPGGHGGCLQSWRWQHHSNHAQEGQARRIAPACRQYGQALTWLCGLRWIVPYSEQFKFIQLSHVPFAPKRTTAAWINAWLAGVYKAAGIEHVMPEEGSACNFTGQCNDAFFRLPLQVCMCALRLEHQQRHRDQRCAYKITFTHSASLWCMRRAR